MYLQNRLTKRMLMCIMVYSWVFLIIVIVTGGTFFLVAKPEPFAEIAFISWGLLELAVYALLVFIQINNFMREVSELNTRAIQRYSQKMSTSYKNIVKKTKTNNPAIDQYRDLLHICYQALNDGIGLKTVNSLLDMFEVKYVVKFGVINNGDDYALVLQDLLDNQLAVIKL